MSGDIAQAKGKVGTTVHIAMLPLMVRLEIPVGLVTDAYTSQIIVTSDEKMRLDETELEVFV